jgi:L-threonylcarbamoyladenylate synthase
MLKVSCDTKGVEIAVKTLQNGGIVVFPTDTVYGIGCDPYNADAIKTIYKIKKRDDSKLFPVLGYSREELERIVEFDDKSKKIADKFWPGQVTLILKIKDEKIKKSLNLEEKIAVRIPKNRCIMSLLKNCKLLVGTSANISGTSSFKDPNECRNNITGYDVFIDDGIIQSSGESTVVEIDDEIKILREGVVSKESILEIE